MCFSHTHLEVDICEWKYSPPALSSPPFPAEQEKSNKNDSADPAQDRADNLGCVVGWPATPCEALSMIAKRNAQTHGGVPGSDVPEPAMPEVDNGTVVLTMEEEVWWIAVALESDMGLVCQRLTFLQRIKHTGLT